MKVDLELFELIILRASIGSEVDIIDEELDNPIYKQDPSIARGTLLYRQSILMNLLEKLHKSVGNHEVTQRQRAKLRTSQRGD